MAVRICLDADTANVVGVSDGDRATIVVNGKVVKASVTVESGTAPVAVPSSPAPGGGLSE